MESLFSRLKIELIYAENYQKIKETRAGDFEYIELFYNLKVKESKAKALSHWLRQSS